MDRRHFLSLSAVSAALGWSVRTEAAVSQAIERTLEEGPVTFRGDGLSLDPKQYAALLGQLANEGIATDSYSLGGAVEALERKFAAMLGKERAIFMPTGTLANHLAVRTLCGARRRVIVQAESHIVNDSGDCAQTLSSLNLIPLAPGGAFFLLDEVREVLDRTASGRVKMPVGCIMIESPVRRRLGQVFDFNEMKRISKFARERSIRLHLDGARLYLASAYSGLAPKRYAELFDTVYVSLYKYFNAASGAVLAGPADVIDGLYHARRMFGGGMPQAWVFAAVATAYADGFVDRFKQAILASDTLIAGLEGLDAYEVERIPQGTNVFKLRAKRDAGRLRAELKEAGVVLPAAVDSVFTLKVNETLLRQPVPKTLEAFARP